MKIHDVHDFDARRAAKEFMETGFTAVDDVSGGLIDCAKEELIDELGMTIDEIDLRMEEIRTAWGPVFVFWNRSGGRAVLAAAKIFVQKHRPGA